jgi:hypothetical protein
MCSYIRVHINAVAKTVMLYLQHDFYDIIFKTNVASGSASPARKNAGCAPGERHISHNGYGYVIWQMITAWKS